MKKVQKVRKQTKQQKQEAALAVFVKDEKHSIEQIIEAHKLVKQSASAAIAYAVWMGRELKRINKDVPDGTWAKFFNENIETRGLSRATAYRYMQLLDRLSPKQIKSLPPTLEGVQASIAKLALPAGKLTAVYKEFGMVADPIKRDKPTSSSSKVADAIADMTLTGVLSKFTEVGVWVKARSQTITDGERDSIRKSIEFLQSLLDAPVEQAVAQC